ncbi:MAG: glycosylase, partial [Ruminococcus sp.]|nr:glycosylase [Ruminococcus sp.]
MEKIKMIGEPLPNMPWQDKPKDIDAPVWRYSENPIIKRNPVKN